MKLNAIHTYSWAEGQAELTDENSALTLKFTKEERDAILGFVSGLISHRLTSVAAAIGQTNLLAAPPVKEEEVSFEQPEAAEDADFEEVSF